MSLLPQVRDVTDVQLQLHDLHASIADPLLDSMNFLNEVVSRYPGAISFAPGRPYEGAFDPECIADYLAVYSRYLMDDKGQTSDQVRTTLFQYGRTNGHIAELIARTVQNDEGIRVVPEAVVVTVGAQEGMLLVLRTLFADQDDVLLVSSPCYVGISGAARLLDIAVAPVPEGENGLDPEILASVACAVRAEGKRPRAVYLVPDFANPSGLSLTVQARKQLLSVAAEQDLIVLEDNPYGFFLREGEPRPTLKSLDMDKRVVYLGSFAKTCFPGARVGYVLADQRVIGPDGYERLLADELSKVKSMTTVNTSTLSQAVIGGMLLTSDCRLREANAPSAAFYRTNLQAALDELDRLLPAQRRRAVGVEWNVPGGGFFLVMRVPFEADEQALEISARDYQVLWTPMRIFYPDGGGTRELRLACSGLSLIELTTGIRRLVAFVTNYGRHRGING